MNGMFGINGLFGYLVAVVIVLVAAFCFGYAAIKVEKSQATNYYKIQNQNSVKMKSTSNDKHYELVKDNN